MWNLWWEDNDYLCNLSLFPDPREDWKVTRTEGPRFHHSWQAEDGQQTIQLANEDVQ